MRVTPVMAISDISPSAQQDDDRSARDWAAMITHYGWLAKGFVFVIIGVLAFQLARRGYSSDSADQSGALRLLADGAIGRVLLLVTSFGLALFAVWQVGQSLVSDESDLLGVAKRIGWLGLGVTYGFLAISGFQIALAPGPAGSTSDTSGSGPGSGGGPGGAHTSPEGLTTWLFGLPGGRLAIAVIGIGTAAVAAYHIRKGIERDFLDDIETDDLDDRSRTALAAAGLVGFIARGLVLGLVGTLFVVAAWQFDADEAAGLDQALRTIAEAPFGRAWLTICALGLMTAGAYDMVTWRRQRLE